jgi:3-methyladenine DNA glycosylase AlkD
MCNEICAELRATPVRTDAIRRLRRKYSNVIAKWAPGDVTQLAMRLVESGGFIKRFVAYELVSEHPEALASLDEKLTERLGRGLDSWGSVDTFALYLSGQAWREGQIKDAVVHRWVRSGDRWWRRAALVSTVPLNSKARGGRGDSARTLEVCELLVADRDDMVVKALSWALRELSKRDSGCVRRFLAKHKQQLAPRVVREVTNKLSTGLKNPRK